MDEFVADQIIRGRQEFGILPVSLKERIAAILTAKGYEHLVTK